MRDKLSELFGHPVYNIYVWILLFLWNEEMNINEEK